jgi:putative transport protein
MIDWLVATLRSDPELLILLSVTWGFASSQVAGSRLGNVTVTLLAAVVVGKLGITVLGHIKSTFLIMLLFAIGYGVGSLKILIDRQREIRTSKTHSASRKWR